MLQQPARLLLVDGHDSHVSWHVVEFAVQYEIHVLCLPVHVTHILQPLVVGCFRVLSKRYNRALRDWLYDNTSDKVDNVVFWEQL